MQQSQATPSRIEMINIAKTYGSICSLRGTDLGLAPDKALGLVGDNDAGRSALTKVFFGVVIPSSGTVRIDGEQQRFTNPTGSHRCHIEMVHQDPLLCDTADVAGNLFIGHEPMKSALSIPFLDEVRVHADAREMFKGLGTSTPDTRLLVRNLSSGQRQAIAVARATAFSPKVLVMDEPTVALAIAEAEAILELIHRAPTRGVSVILITHYLQDLLLACNRIMVMYGGTGVADRQVFDTSLSDIVNLIVGKRFTAYSATTH